MINDNYGHKAGDAILIHVANAIASVIRESDMAARLGGDEFVVLLTDIHDIEDTQRSIHDIHKAIATEIAFACHTLCVTASIGVAIFPDDGERIDDLITKADASMFEEKKQAKADNKLLAIGKRAF
ncbi:diguanylate cyclase domain-containing protein [Methylomarinum vadi]|uniref:diguanylate cyclase domain-containing protein n=1 Tax=Methylomarinum vadi TaxID=438855 RepID=UPI0009FDD1E4|nr:GGDEF domain-containing protein [Methylomarinum vadi]